MSALAWHAACAQVVAFGASNVYGWNVDATEAFPARLESALRTQGYAITVLNAGMFGNTTVQMRARMDRDIPPGTTIVLLDVSGGPYNDSLSGVTREQGKANLQAISEALRARGIKVVPVDFAAVPMEYRQGDRRHLTPEGHEWLASQLLPQITKLLGPPPRPGDCATAARCSGQ